MPIRQLIEID